ncbi:MAG: sigma-70 family RNA polymerase sigma factor [Planctomycetes bacterium]|nr:sigma-70 family RNA polymerase sigma factor [Planctomycetota bacterium]
MALKDMTALTAAATPARTWAEAADVEATLRRHLHGVWRYLRMLGAAPELADDLAQEAFVVVLRRDAVGLDPAALATFLRRTARFLFLRHLRDRDDVVQLADAVDELWVRDCADDDGDGMLAALRACVGELQGRSRLAVERSYGLHAERDRSRVELARELGMEPNGVKTLLQRVRQTLRACVERRRQS